ncbi:hypothetical protein N9I41_04295, partial [Flavobacteriaceae bacterium]|nr:hypothetical protein [Flavobacteriaceae bacterium]
MKKTVGFYTKQYLVLLGVFLCSALGWGQNIDLSINNSNQILVPIPSNRQYCIEVGSNLTFQVNNDSTGSGDTIDLNTNSLVVTLTVSSNTFAPSGTTTSVTFTTATTSNATSTRYIIPGGVASFDWPSPLFFSEAGTTTIEIEIAATGNTDAVSSNNTVTYELGILANPNTPVLTTNYGSTSTVEICAGDTITFFANGSIAGSTYVFFVNNITIQSSTTQSFDPVDWGIAIANGDIIDVIASTGVASCSTAAASITVQTNAISTVGTITTASSTVCYNALMPALTGSPGTASGTVSYQWQSRDQTTSLFIDINLATTQNYTPTSRLTTDTFFRRITVSNTGTTTCDALSNVIEIKVDPAPAANITTNISGVVVTGGSTATICSGEEVTFIATPVAGGSYVFTIGGAIVRARADSNVYTTTALIAGDQVGVRVFNGLTADTAACSTDSASITIAV